MDIDKWFEIIDGKVENDIELLFEKYIIEYCNVNVCEVSDSDRLDMSVTFYELLNLKYRIDY